MTARIILKAGREKPVVQRHPWVFSGAIARVEGALTPGGPVDVVDADGTLLARGYGNQASQIRARILTWDLDEQPDAAAWRRRLAAAIDERARDGRLAAPDGACRLVFAESDGLPGLIIDRYGPWLVLQALTAGVDVRKAELAAAAAELVAAHTPVLGVYERSDVDVRAKEGLQESTGVLWGAEPTEVVIAEPGAGGASVSMSVDVIGGHKTGGYLDQADNRRRVATFCDGAEVLNGFSYTGGFGLHALAAGARRVVNIDSSVPALDAAVANAERMGWSAARHEDPLAPELDDVQFACSEGNVFGVLRAFREAEKSFDVVIVDPPKFVHTASHVDKAARAYKDLALVALQILRPGGILVTFSCSGLLTPDLFQKIAFGAALDAGRDVAIIERMTQSADHPVLLTFPEGAYLKGLICRAR